MMDDVFTDPDFGTTPRPVDVNELESVLERSGKCCKAVRCRVCVRACVRARSCQQGTLGDVQIQEANPV